MTTRNPVTLTSKEIAWLIRHDGLELKATSPLAGALEAGGERGKKVDERLVSDGSRVKAFQILAAPTRLSRIVIPGVRQSSALYFYGASTAKSAPMVGFCRQEGGARIEGDDVWELLPRTALGDLAKLALQGSGGATKAGDVSAGDFAFELRLEGLFLLAAAIDAARAGLAADFLGRRISEAPDYRRDDLEGFFQDGRERYDPRWMVSALSLLTPPEQAAAEFSIARGFDELRDLGLLEPRGSKNWRCTPALDALVRQFASPLPAVAITTVFSNKFGEIDHRGHHCFLAMASAPYWFDMSGLFAEESRRITVRQMQREKLSSAVREALLSPPSFSVRKRA